MMSRLFILLTTVTILAVGNAAAQAASKTANPVTMFDTDNDGTVDLAEAKKAASALFATLDRDHDGTLDKGELSTRLRAKAIQTADPDHDSTLTLDEYLAVVAQRFAAADLDKDGTLDAKELNSRAGRALLRLLK